MYLIIRRRLKVGLKVHPIGKGVMYQAPGIPILQAIHFKGLSLCTQLVHRPKKLFGWWFWSSSALCGPPKQSVCSIVPSHHNCVKHMAHQDTSVNQNELSQSCTYANKLYSGLYNVLERFKVHDWKIYNRKTHYEPCCRLQLSVLYFCIGGLWQKCFLGHTGFLAEVSWVDNGNKLPHCHIASPVYSSYYNTSMGGTYVGRNSDDPLGVPPPPTLPSCELFGSHVMRFEEWLRSSGENPQGCIICGGVVVSKASPSV